MSTAQSAQPPPGWRLLRPEIDYIVEDNVVVFSDFANLATNSEVPRARRDEKGNVTAVFAVPTTGGNSEAYCRGKPRTARQDGGHCNVGRHRLPDRG